ncbi:tetratricopeptide repeat protein [Hyalangium minutum]|uniref:Tetratricopeptide repeat domain protein n=1 Tax=Hyalangium minutum TaxID=394096 RepID=A0A085W2S1_9BACT|nr:tetratricopeptide repeat protein [Hyalangium minutum]KFE61984.1 tetratricopeptide repeat domain protein [Hyalangium minutum]
MRWNVPVLVLGLGVLLGPVVLAQAPAGGEGSVATDSERSTQALAVYEQGKRLYDAKDYAGALEKFDQAAALEPGKARWQYNRGLTLRKLNRFPEAREALLQSLTLDPEYKKAEIDDKLREMGFSQSDPSPAATDGSTSAPSPASPESEPNDTAATVIAGVICFAGPLLFVGGLIFLIRFLIRRAKARGEDAPPQRRAPGKTSAKTPMRSVDVSPLDQRMEQVASALTSVEHALRLEEDADLRALLNQATMAEQRARDELAKARVGKVTPEAAEVPIRAAEEGAKAAEERARTLFGDRAFAPEGERVGCYFCARPLANASFRMQVPLKRGETVTSVLACPPCANMAAAGQPPPVKVRVEGNGRMVHWSELGGFDPYTHRHNAYPGTRNVPAWDFAPQRSLAEVAAIAAGGAAIGGLAAYGVSKLLDLDSAQEAAAAQAAAQAATQAAARKASEQREERDWRDHS